MLTGRRFWTFAMVLALCVIVTAGCKRRRSKGSTTINQGSDIFTTDSFPGAPVQDGNVSDDKRAFSNADSDFNFNLRVTMNGDRGTAMATYEIDEGGTQNQIFAHYFDGSTWTPPVQLSALDVDLSSASGTDVGATVHAFINTSEHVSEDAQERDGDCLIFWRRDDVTDTATESPNSVLFVTYFDVSNKDVPSARYGFQQFATRVSSQDEAAEDVTDFGIVTDGLCGEARFGQGDPTYSYGDQTTSIEVFWRQLENNSVVVDDGSVEDSAPYTARFDLATAGDPDVPIPPTFETRLSVAAFGASDAGTTSGDTQVDNLFCVYNGYLFWRGVAVDAGTGTGTDFDPFDNPIYGAGMSVGAGRDVTIQFVHYTLSTAAITPTAHLQLVTPVAGPDDLDENNAHFLQTGGDNRSNNGIFGVDEGLTNTVIFTVQLTEDPAGFGTLTNSAGLVITTINDLTGAIIENAAFGIDSVSDADHVSSNEPDTRMSRNGDYIWIAYAQYIDITAGADTLFGLRCNEYFTTRLPEDGVPIAPESIATALSGTFTVMTPSAAVGSLDFWTFQDHLGYICGAQSNPDIMSLFYESSDGTADTMFQVELESSVILAAPTAFVSAFETYENGDQEFGLAFGATFDTAGIGGFRATDSGEDGFIFASYGDDVDGTATDDIRWFAERTGVANPSATTEIDSAVTFRSFGTPFFEDIELIGTPRGSEIGQFDAIDLNDSDARPHGNEQIHVFFREPEGTEDDGMDDAYRTRVYHVGADSLTFGEDFSPNAGAGVLYEFPFDLDLPFINPSNGASEVATAVGGSTVGVWFEELGHLYYQEYNGSNGDEVGWRNIDGESDPALIDDDTDIEIDNVQRFFTRQCVCDDLEGAMIFWTKQLDDNSNSERLQVRVRSGDSN